MPLLAFNRKDSGWRIEWQQPPKAANDPVIPPIWPMAPEDARTVAVSWPVPALPGQLGRHPPRTHVIVVTSAGHMAS